jgi:3'5'-cyclic nucleotide phosphodiesterase
VNSQKAFFYNVLQERRNACRSLQDSFIQALEICQLDNRLDSNAQHLLSVCEETLNWVESAGATQAQKNLEPAYHNRQHFADILVALAIFLKETHELSPTKKLLLLLCALVHDFGHRGLSNLPTSGTQEEETVRQILSDTSPLSKLSSADRETIKELVLGTTPANLSKTNQRYLDSPSNQNYFMQSLLNDADIATSFVEPLTPILSRLILIELGNLNPSEKQIGEMMLAFKKHYSLTTPIAKAYLDRNQSS